MTTCTSKQNKPMMKKMAKMSKMAKMPKKAVVKKTVVKPSKKKY